MAKGTVNKVTLIGRLGQDPEIRFSGDGKAIATFSVATNESWKNKDGEVQERTLRRLNPLIDREKELIEERNSIYKDSADKINEFF